MLYTFSSYMYINIYYNILNKVPVVLKIPELLSFLAYLCFLSTKHIKTFFYIQYTLAWHFCRMWKYISLKKPRRLFYCRINSWGDETHKITPYSSIVSPLVYLWEMLCFYLIKNVQVNVSLTSSGPMVSVLPCRLRSAHTEQGNDELKSSQLTSNVGEYFIPPKVSGDHLENIEAIF